MTIIFHDDENWIRTTIFLLSRDISHFSSNLKLDLSLFFNLPFLGTGGRCKTSQPHSSTVSRPLSPFSFCFSCFWGFLPCWAPRSSGASCPYASQTRITIRNCTRGRGAISTLFPQASSPFSRLESKTEKLQKRSFQRLLFIKYYSTVVSQILLQYKKKLYYYKVHKRDLSTTVNFFPPLLLYSILSSSRQLLFLKQLSILSFLVSLLRCQPQAKQSFSATLPHFSLPLSPPAQLLFQVGQLELDEVEHGLFNYYFLLQRSLSLPKKRN